MTKARDPGLQCPAALEREGALAWSADDGDELRTAREAVGGRHRVSKELAVGAKGLNSGSSGRG